MAATIGYSSNPSARIADYESAQNLSASELDTFSRFTEPYLPSAFKFLNGEKLSPGLKENIQQGTRDRLCIAFLASTELTPKLKKACSGTHLKSGSAQVKFDDQVNLPHPARSCALYNFTVRERAERESKLTR